MKKNIKDRKWFKLDNAAKLYPSIVSTRVSTVFRLSATLYENIDPVILQKSLDEIIYLFKHFKVRLRKGLFWYYFEETHFKPIVQEETYYPCMYLNFKDKDTLPFRVIYYNNKISVEISHSVTDGFGATIFLKTLLFTYCKLKGLINDLSINELVGIDLSSENTYEDAFHKYYNDKIHPPQKLNKAFHLHFPLNKKGEYHIITGIIPTLELYNLAKSYNSTVTKFIIALFFESLLDFVNLDDTHKNKLRPVTINVPVNLRNLFPSETLRNFFVSLTPSIDISLGHYSLKEILEYIDHYFGICVNKKYISQYISRNVKNEKLWKIRLLPLPLKNLIIPFIYNRYGEINYTSSVSNLGNIVFPKSLTNHIEKIDVYPPPSRGNLIKMAMLSYNNKTCISFGSLTTIHEIEKIFFRKLRKMGLPIKIEANTQKEIL